VRIGNRIFPYPILNNFEYVSDFKKSSKYELTNTFTENSDVYRTSNSIVFKDIHFKLEDSELRNLYEQGKIKSCLIVEASASVYREMFELTDKPAEITIPIHLLKGDVYVSSYMYANEDIMEYYSEGFDDDYEGYTINIEKYSIIAVDDGFKFKVSVNEKEDNKASSIFMIIRKDENSDIMEYENSFDRIKIYLPEKHFKNYESLKMQSIYNNEFFSMLVIPVLTSCLYELQMIAITDDSINDISDIIDDKAAWFKSICLAYEREMKQKLTIDDFKECQPLKLAQIILNKSSLKGMEDFSVQMLNGDRGDEDE